MANIRHGWWRFSGARPIPIHYSLARSADAWKVFDVAIADVSLVTNYRSSFAVEVDNGGLDGLLKSLQEKIVVSKLRRRRQPEAGTRQAVWPLLAAKSPVLLWHLRC